MRREFPVGPHDDGRLLEPQGRDPVHHRRDPQARGFPPGTLSWGSLPGNLMGNHRHPSLSYLSTVDHLRDPLAFANSRQERKSD